LGFPANASSPKSPATFEQEHSGGSGAETSAGTKKYVDGENQVYRALFESVNEGVALFKVVYSSDGKPVDYVFVDVNPAYECIMSTGKSDRVGRKASEVYDQEAYLEALAAAASTRKSSTIEYYFAYVQRFLKISAFPFTKETVAVILADQTQAKIADDALKESEQKHRFLFTNMIDGYAYCQMVLDDTGKPIDFIYREVNDAFETLTGLKKGAVLGKKVSEAIPETVTANPELIDIYGRVALTGKAEKFEIYFKPLRRWFNISVFSPKRGFFVSVFENISERKRLETQLEEYTRNLEQLVEERTRQLRDAERLATIGYTAGMIGHDIRDPLQAVINELYLVKSELTELPKECKQEPIKESLAFIEKETNYVVKIAWDLQDFARPLKPDLVEVDVCRLIPEIVASLDVPDDIQTNILCPSGKMKLDPIFLKRILTNLVTNAVQAMPQGGKLTIGTATEPGKAIITVEDTGFGIPEEAKPKIWSPLFTTKAKGQGLGLAVAKRLVEVQGGKISFESQVGKGTKFTIEFPQ
jgi:PAS domain S-box-containing protein